MNLNMNEFHVIATKKRIDQPQSSPKQSTWAKLTSPFRQLCSRMECPKIFGALLILHAVTALPVIAWKQPVAIMGLLMFVTWPRKRATPPEYKPQDEQSRTDALNETIIQLGQLPDLARDYILVKEAANLELPHVFYPHGEQPQFNYVERAYQRNDQDLTPKSFTLHAISFDGNYAQVSLPGQSAVAVPLSQLARMLRDRRYAPGDITFSLIEKIERPRRVATSPTSYPRPLDLVDDARDRPEAN